MQRHKLVAITMWLNSRLSTWLPPKTSFQDEICKTCRKFSRPETVSVSRLKPAYLPPNTLPAQPPTRGRPPLSKPLPSFHKKPSKLSSKPFLKWPSSVLYLPLDHRGLENFLHVFQISSWNEIGVTTCDGAVAGRETWTQTSCRALRSWWKGVNHYTGEGHQLTCNLGSELRLHPSQSGIFVAVSVPYPRFSWEGERGWKRPNSDEGTYCSLWYSLYISSLWLNVITYKFC